jgi:hypothetical protein
MTRFASRYFVTLLLLLASQATLRAQFSPDSPAGISAGLAKLFGNINGFTAKADIQVLDTNRQETMRTPMNFAFLDNRIRMEIDMTQVKGKSASPVVVAGLKQAGLDRIINIIRLDKKRVYLIFPVARSYVNASLSGTDAEAAKKNLQIRKTALGTEAIEGRPCTKNQVVVKNSKGALLLEATTWNAADLKEFPVQIALPTKDNTTIMRFREVQLVRPAPAQFELPSGYAKYPGMEALLLAVSQKQNPPPKVATSKPPAKSTEPKPAVKPAKK